MLPTQYPTKVNEEVSVLFVRPAVLEGISVHAKKSEMTNGTVIKYPPHFTHLYSRSLGNRAIIKKPQNGGIVENIMNHLATISTIHYETSQCIE